MNELWSNMSQSLGDKIGTYVPQIVGAIAILIIGWIFALIVSAIVRGAIRRTGIGNKLASWLGKSDGVSVSKNIGKGVFWLIMLLVFVAIFQALNLTIVTQPINSLLNTVFAFIPQLIGAAILVVIAWIVATIVRMVVLRVLEGINLDEKVSGGSKEGEEEGGTEENKFSLSKTVSDALYWLIFLLFLPAILTALGLQGLLTPVQELLNKFLGFLPNIIAAVLIALIGWFVATIVRRLVTNLLEAVGIDRLGERFKLPVSLSGIVGIIVYVLIIIPVMLAALNALQLDTITLPVSNMLSLILSALPNIFAASIVIVISYLLGQVVAGLVTSLLTGVGFNSIMSKLGLGKEPAEGEEVPEGKRTPSEIVGTLVLIGIMIFAIFEASSLLGFSMISDLLSQFSIFAGHIILGLIILGIGLYLANLIAKAVKASGTAYADLLSTVARVVTLILIGAIALRQMGIANEIINMAFGLLLGAIAIAVAIAFGVGGREMAARKLEEWSKSMKKKKEE